MYGYGKFQSKTVRDKLLSNFFWNESYVGLSLLQIACLQLAQKECYTLSLCYKKGVNSELLSTSSFAMTADVRLAPFPEQPRELLQIAPEDLLDTLCERTSNVAKGALLLVSALFTGYSGFSFFYTASTQPSANALAVAALCFTGGMCVCCIIQSYLPPCLPPCCNSLRQN